MYSFLKKAIERFIGHPEKSTVVDSCCDLSQTRMPPTKLPVDPEWEAFKSRESYFALAETAKTHPLTHTSRVTFELSNLCNYSKIHKKCPLNLSQEPTILPRRIVFDVLDYLAKHDFAGQVAFHNYCEPLIDPRLFEFIGYARRRCSRSDIYICTNGFYLNQTMADELVSAGVTSIRVSAYSQSEFERLSKIKPEIPFTVWKARLDDRLNVYEASINDTGKPCFAPLNEIIVAREGCISLCCLDWQRVYRFGNLYEQTFEQVLSNGQLQEIYERLSKGDRFLDICRRCGWSR